MELSKEQSKMLKGIAIIFMLCLHLYNRTDYITGGYYQPYLQFNGLPIVYYLSFICDACVPIYCFCAGYAAYLQKNRAIKSTFKRLENLLETYWIVLVITCLFGIFFKNAYIPKNIITLLGNVFLYDISYVGAWWFMQTYFLLILSAPLLIKILDYLNKYILLIAVLIIYFVSYYFRMIHPIHTDFYLINITIKALVLYGTSLLSFIIGMLFRKTYTISKIRKYFNHNSTLIGIILIVASVCGHIIIKSMIVAPFFALLFIVGYILIDIKGLLKNILLFLGNHSTNIWLIHMQFYSIFFKQFVFCTNTVIGCFIILLTVCLFSSYFINGLKQLLVNKCNFRT